ncbi:MAG: class I adenylate-forming enzyme family protein [Solirubrobacteraceae bacterium]
MSLIVDGPRWWARVAPDKPAVVFEGDELGYAALDGWSDRVGALLGARGVTPGARVGILAGNSIEYVVAVVAVLKAGAVVVPMSTRLTVAELVTLTESSEPWLVITDAEQEDRAAEASAAGIGYSLALIGEITELRDGERITYSRTEVDPDEPAALIYTSGTTGEPKGVIFTNTSILSFIAEWGLTEDGFDHDMRLLWLLPLGGAPGTIWGIIHTIVRGSTMYLERTFRPAQAVAAIAAHRITCMLGVPILFEQMSLQENYSEADLKTLTTAHVGGARVSDQLLRSYSDKGVLLRQIYGMTEAGGSASANAKADAIDHPERCGRGNVFTQLKVVRHDGSECEPGEPGEILIKGPSITKGYWRNPEATAQTIVDGWLHSGDLGELDETGNLRMVDRLKDLIISGGLNISPTEIENVIDELEAVVEVAVVPAEDEKFGETPAAIVRLSAELKPGEIVAHCNGRLADFKVPRYVILTDEPLPRMASGKLAKRVIRERHPDIADLHAKVR